MAAAVLTLDCVLLKTNEQRLNAVRDWMQGLGDEFPTTQRAVLRQRINQQIEALDNPALSAIVIKAFSGGRWDITVQCSTEDTAEDDDQLITPWEVQSAGGINYLKLVNQFGSSLIDEELLVRFEKVTGSKPHPWLRRGYFFSHRYASCASPSSAEIT